MIRDFFDPSAEDQHAVLIDAATLRKAGQFIESCGNCNANDAEIPFEHVLDRVTGSDPSLTDYVLELPGKCLKCFGEIREKTLVELIDEE
jgi:hypothetical protein